MIEINLLPKELRKNKIELPNISFLPILAGLLGIIVIIHLLFSLSVNLKARTLRRLERKWQEILPDKKNADKVVFELTAMRSKIDAIDKLIQNRMSWAEKLSDLSDAMIPGVWLDKLWIEKRRTQEKQKPQKGRQGKVEPKEITVKTLHLNGSVIMAGGEETATVGKFMGSLKNNSGFSADFDDIESAYMQQTKLKETEVMDFELICYFK